MLKITPQTLNEFHGGTSPLALFAFEDAGLAGANFLPQAARKAILARAKDDWFQGKAGEVASFLASDGRKQRRFLIVGLGKRKEFNDEAMRKGAASLFKAAKKRLESIAVASPGPLGALAEGLHLTSYDFPKYRKPDEEVKLREARVIVGSAGERSRAAAALEKAELYAEAVCWVRDLVNEGPSDKSPETLAKSAQDLAGPGVSVKVIDQEEAEKLGMGSFLGVSRGSAKPPYFVHLVYKPKGAKKKVGLVGKGITFDSGGLSLKPPQGMETMKMDMAGAATVFGVFKVLARLKPKVEVHGFAPLAYNMPGPDALKPGDIVRAMNGKSIEILNTDAEGRLILADALVYANQQELDVILDLATLTGAVLVALGSSVTGAMTNDKATLQRILAASKKTSEAIWELPLVKDYQDQIKSKVADLQNIGKVRGEAGTIIGGLFLQEFVGKTPWVHFDFAGTAWTDGGTAYCAPGGTGAMVRTLLEYLGSF